MSLQNSYCRAEHSHCKAGLAYSMIFYVAKTILISVTRETCSKAVTDNHVNEQVKILDILEKQHLSADNLNWKMKSVSLTE